MKNFEFEQKNLFGVCPFMTAQHFLSRKWTIPILRELLDGTKRFNELQKKFGITRTTLTQRLKLLEHRSKFRQAKLQKLRRVHQNFLKFLREQLSRCA